MRVWPGLLLWVSMLVVACGGKADDWQYTPPPFGGGPLGLILPIVGLVIFTWLVIALFLIVKGRPVFLGDRYRTSGLRKAGVLLLLGFAVLAGMGAALFLAGGMQEMSAPISGMAPQPQLAESKLGFAAGGAKDIHNFRRNIQEKFLPLPTDITYEGLFYDYHFDTGRQESCEKLFCPSYALAVTADPFSKKEDVFVSVGLNSGIREKDFQRKRLNLVIVLDVSGSMGSSFSRYYYDREESGELDPRSKMEVANRSVVALLGHLNAEDRFGMVLFDDQAYLAKPLRLVGETDMQSIASHILEIEPQGGTRMSAGMRLAAELFEDWQDADRDRYENRILFLTDAMPNLGETSDEALLGQTRSNSKKGVHTTFIGVGVDFNTELVEIITKIRGANYCSVHSPAEFERRMDEEFEYMVTPLVFDLVLELDARGYRIERVFGSPEADRATGEILRVNTLFPSKTEEGETRGGLVLLKLERSSDEPDLRLRVSYRDRSGKAGGDERNIRLETGEAPFFDNTGIRKGILLVRYASLMKNWILDERRAREAGEPVTPTVHREDGIPLPPAEPAGLGRWERQSMPLRRSIHYKELFELFRDHLKAEMEVIGDPTLERELEILQALIDLGSEEGGAR